MGLEETPQGKGPLVATGQIQGFLPTSGDRGPGEILGLLESPRRHTRSKFLVDEQPNDGPGRGCSVAVFDQIAGPRSPPPAKWSIRRATIHSTPCSNRGSRMTRWPPQGAGTLLRGRARGLDRALP